MGFYRPFGVGVEHFRVATQFEEWKDAAVAEERKRIVEWLLKESESPKREKLRRYPEAFTAYRFALTNAAIAVQKMGDAKS